MTLSPNMPLWHKVYSQLVIFKKLQTVEDALDKVEVTLL